MERYKLSDHIHYDRNDPSKDQSIYFDIAPTFHVKLNAVIAEVEDGLNRDRIDDITVALKRINTAIETTFGELTFGELLYVSHYVSGMLTANTAEHHGFKRGYEAALRKLAPTSN